MTRGSGAVGSASWRSFGASATATLLLAWTRPVGAATAADYFVHSLPGAPPEPLIKMHAGHVEVAPEHNGNLFFWHFENQHIADKQRTVIWINGGPGCSSEDGALMEIGPYRVADDHTLTLNNGSWHEFANLLFVDNPIGTGFSYADTDSYLHELDEMADQFVIFLEKFFAMFPEYEHDDLYIAGESYAGQHIPYIAKHILERNKEPTTEHPWALSGLLIGNGWISPAEQYEAYLQYAYTRGILDKDSAAAERIEVQHRLCQKDLATQVSVDVSDCEAILQQLLEATTTREGKTKMCYNMYDVRLKDVYPSCGMNWPPDLAAVTPYLRRDDVVNALHVNAMKKTGWEECNGRVGSQFRASKSAPSVQLMPDLLAELPIVLFSGAEDLICNHLGTEALISNLKWGGGKGFELTPGNWAPRRTWTFEGDDAGFWQEARNLTYVLFYNSSHMVPFDYARRTRDMLDRFMGVDISSIGGAPTDSRLDGEKGPETTVGGAAGNGSSSDQQAEQAKLDAAKWEAYRKSGEIVLFLVIIATAAWAYFVWRDRQRSRRHRGYRGVRGGDPEDGGEDDGGGGAGGDSGGLFPRFARAVNVRPGTAPRGSGLEGFRSKRSAGRGVEPADFDERELDDLHVITPVVGTAPLDEPDRYSVGGASDESDEDEDEDEDGDESESSAGKKKKEQVNGHRNGNGNGNGHSTKP